MVTEKVTEFRSAMKGFITRLMILAAIVVFGAIAIAQAQRARVSDSTSSDAPKGETGTTQAAVNPIRVTQLPPAQANFAQLSPGESEQDAFHAAADPAENAPDGDRSPISPIETADYTETADESLAGDAELPPAESTGNADEAPPLLDESPLQVDGPMKLRAQSRRNPYRDSEPASSAGDDLPPLLDTEDSDSSSSEPTDTEPSLESDEQKGLESFEDQPELEEAVDATDADPPADGNSSDEPTVEETNAEGTGPEYDSLPALDSVEPIEEADQLDSQFGGAEPVEGSALPADDFAQRTNIVAKGRPGPQSLEGPQTPSLMVEKIAPPEVQVGKPARFQVRVRNIGQVAADNVLIRDEIPEGTSLINASPEATSASNGALLWEVGTINPGDESIVTVELMPVAEGQVGSTATVSFQTSATARSRATKPTLSLEHTAPKQVLVGENVRFTIKLSNVGSGAAQQVVVEEDVPDGLAHSSGSKLEYSVGTIPSGTSRHLELILKAAHPGKVTNTLVARGDAGLMVKDTIELEVVAPKLQIGITGPARRYLEREATFTISVANPGTAPARNVQLVAELPPGLKFLSTNNSGHYDQVRNAVIWSLEQLPAGEMGRAQFIAIPTEMGQHRIRSEAKADPALSANQEHVLTVEGIAALFFGVVDQTDPIEVGGTTTYVITVENQGSKTASNVRLVAEAPPGMKPVNGEGTMPAVVSGQQVIFQPIERLAPKAKTSFRVFVQGVSPGDQKLRVQMTSDDISAPVIKEESTRVYSD
jgi:uncharacterized repeat protein (TIGR01451 family)